jgi:hypothetical protein
MIEHFHLLFRGMLDIQSLGPVAPLFPRFQHHVVFFAQVADIRLVLGQQTPLVYTLDPELLHMLQGLDILADFTGDIAAAVHQTFVEDVQKSIIDFYVSVQQGVAHVEFAS